MNRGFATTFVPQILHSGIDVQEVFGGKGKAVKSTDSGKGVDAGRRRKLTDEQANLLEMSFLRDRKLESERKDRLAFELGLDPRQVAVWFQNRRARWKGKQLEEEYSMLKNAHEDAIFQKCQLETMVLELKQQLFQAEEEKKRLAQRLEKYSTRNPTSSYLDVVDPTLLGELGMGGYGTTFGFCESNCLRPSWGAM